MNKFPLIVKLSRSNKEFYSNEVSNTSFYVKRGENLSVTATQDSNDKNKYELVLHSANHLPFYKRSVFHLFVIIISMSALFAGILRTPLIPFYEIKNTNVAYKEELDSLRLKGGLAKDLQVKFNTILSEKDELIEVKDQKIQNLRGQLYDSKIDLEQAKGQLKVTKAMLNDSQSNNSELRKQAKQQEANIASLESEINNLNSQIQEAQLTISTLERTAMITNNTLSVDSLDNYNHTVAVLIANTIESMELFYTNNVLFSRNYHHANEAIKGFDRLINEFGRTEFIKVRKKFYKDFHEGIDKENRKNRRKNS